MLKICIICKKPKDAEKDYYRQTNARADKKMARCKECFKEYVTGKRKMAGDYLAGYSTAYDRFGKLLKRLVAASRALLKCTHGSRMYCLCKASVEAVIKDVETSGNNVHQVRRIKAPKDALSKLLSAKRADRAGQGEAKGSQSEEGEEGSSPS